MTDPKEFDMLVKKLRAAEASERIYGFDRMVDLIVEADDTIGALAAARSTERAAHAETKRERDEARKALEPFASLANAYDGIPPPKYFGDTDGEIRYHDDHKTLVEIGKLRAARRALGGKADG